MKSQNTLDQIRSVNKERVRILSVCADNTLDEDLIAQVAKAATHAINDSIDPESMRADLLAEIARIQIN
jgi:hypothetical protein